MLLFDIGKVCGQKYSPKNQYFFASFNNDRGLSLNDKTKDYVDRNTVGLKINFYKNTTPQLLEHIGLQNMKVGVKANFG